MRSDLVRRDSSGKVASGDDPESSVFSRCFIEMKTKSDHLLEKLKGRLNVGCVVFHRPRSVAGNVRFCPDGNGKVLMPGDGPIFFGRFIKEDTSDRMIPLREEFLKSALGKDLRFGADIADTSQAEFLFETICFFGENLDLRGGKCSRNDEVSVF